MTQRFRGSGLWLTAVVVIVAVWLAPPSGALAAYRGWFAVLVWALGAVAAVLIVMMGIRAWRR